MKRVMPGQTVDKSAVSPPLLTDLHNLTDGDLGEFTRKKSPPGTGPQLGSAAAGAAHHF